MYGILKRLEKVENMRDDVVKGEFWSFPQLGKGFCFFVFANGNMRLIETAHVTKICCKNPDEVEFEAKDGCFKLLQVAN